MSIRIHIVAARRASADKMREAFAHLGPVEVRAAEGWAWFTASVWSVGGADLLRGVEQLDGPCVFVTTEDGSRWHLRLRAKGFEPFNACHEFGFLRGHDAEEEERDEGTVPETPVTEVGVEEKDEQAGLPEFFKPEPDDDEMSKTAAESLIGHFRSLNCPIPDEIAERLKTLSDRVAVLRAFFQWQAGAVADALQRLGVPHRRDEIEAVLTGANVTATELDTDIGNLPRFLVALGLGPEFQSWLDGQLAEREEIGEEEPEPAGPPPDFSQPVLERARSAQAEPIDGGPVPLQLSDIYDLLRLISFCDERFELAILIDGADTARLEELFGKVTWISLHRDGSLLSVGIEQAGETLRVFAPEILPDLATVRDAAHFELVAAGPESPAGRQRYAGGVRRGVWEIAYAFPKLDAAALVGALDLSHQASGTAPIEARDEDEIRKVLEAANRHVIFSDNKLGREGLRFKLEDWQREWLVLFLFRERFRRTWNVEVREKEEALEQEEWRAIMDRVAEQFAAPNTGEVIYEGTFSTYTRGDLGALDERIRNSAALTDADFFALGFTLLGDVICGKLGDTIVRAYAGLDGHTYGVQYLNKWAQMGREFFTPIEGGGSLTTTTNFAQPSSMKRGVFFKTSNYDALADIHADHLRGLAILGEMGGHPAPIEPHLVGFAACLDAFLSRQQQDSE